MKKVLIYLVSLELALAPHYLYGLPDEDAISRLETRLKTFDRRVLDEIGAEGDPIEEARLFLEGEQATLEESEVLAPLLHQKLVSLRSPLGVSSAVRAATVHRMRGGAYEWGQGEIPTDLGGSHVVRPFQGLFLKYVSPSQTGKSFLGIQPLVERALYGLYHFVFGETDVLAPVSLISLSGIPVRRAIKDEHQQRINRALEGKQLLETPTFGFLKWVVDTLGAESTGEPARSLLETIRQDQSLDDINLHKDLFMRGLREALRNKAHKDFLRKKMKLTSLSDLEADRNIHFKQDEQEALLQVSQKVEGELLEEVLDRPLDLHSFAVHVLGSLLTHGGDYKGDNLKVREGKIIGIDNDFVFEPTFKDVEGGRHEMRLHNLLYFLPQMDELVPFAIKERLGKLNPEVVLLNWLTFIRLENARFEGMRPFISPEFLGPTEGVEGDSLALPLKLSYDVIAQVYEGLQKLVLIMQAPHLTLSHVFQKMEPVAFAVYESVKKKAGNNPLEAHRLVYQTKIETEVDPALEIDMGVITTHMEPFGQVLAREKTTYSPKQEIDVLWRNFLSALDFQKISDNLRRRGFLERLFELNPEFYDSLPDEWQGPLESALESALKEVTDTSSPDNREIHPLYRHCLGKGGVHVPTDLAYQYSQCQQTNPSFNPLLEEMMKRDRDLRFRIGLDEMTTLVPTPYPLWGARMGRRYLTQAAYDQLFDEKRQVRESSSQGRRQIGTFIGSRGIALYGKFLPEIPGREEQVGALGRRLFGRGTPHTELVRLGFKINLKVGEVKEQKIEEIESAPLLMSEGIEGHTLRDIEDEGLLTKIDPVQFGEMFVTTLLTNPEDGNRGNYILEPHLGPLGEETYHVVGIDNDRSFVPALAREEVAGSGRERIKVQVKSVIYAMDQMRNPLEASLVEKIKEMNPGEILKSWLQDMEEKEKAYQGLYPADTENRQAFLLKLLKAYKVFIGVPHPKGSILELYSKFMHLQRVLRKTTTLPMIDILRALERSLAHRYEPVLGTPLSLRERYLRTAEADRSVSTTEQTLEAANIPLKQDMFREAQRTARRPQEARKDLEAAIRLEDERALGRQRILEGSLQGVSPHQIYSALKEVDFNELSDEAQKRILSALPPLKKLSLKGVRLDRKGSVLSDELLRDLETLTLEGTNGLDYDFIERLHELHQRTVGGLKLTRLRLTNVLTLRDFHFWKLVGENQDIVLPLLEVLDLRGCRNLREIRINAPHLKRLNIEGCEALHYLSPTLPVLEELLTDTNKLTPENVLNILITCPRLKELRVGERTDFDDLIYAGAPEPLLFQFLDKTGKTGSFARKLGVSVDPRSTDIRWVMGEALKRQGKWNEQEKSLNIVGDAPIPRTLLLRIGLLSSEWGELRSLNLRENQIGASEVAALAAALPHMSQLTQLDLSQNNIGASEVATLAAALPQMSQLTQLNLGNNNIGTSGAEALAPALSQMNQLRELYLEGNLIRASGGAVLAPALSLMSQLRELNLNVNDIGPTGAKAIFGIFPLCTELITKLDFGYNRIGDSGAIVLSETLLHMTQVTFLNFRYNEIGVSGATALASALSHLAQLGELDLAGNSISTVGARALSAPLLHTSQLTSLNLEWNQIGDSGATALAPALSQMSQLTSLNFGYNKIDASGAEALASALRQLTQLGELDLAGNSIGPIGARALFQSLRQLTQLRKLNLRGNWIRVSGATALAPALSQMSQLTSLNLRFNGIENSGATALFQSLRQLTQLRELDLKGNLISQALFFFPRLTQLTYLNLKWNDIGTSGVQSLSESLPHMSQLTWLGLKRNGIGDSEAAALVTALPQMSQLRELDLRGNKINSSLEKHLKARFPYVQF